jgi:hypothetical protein
MGTDGKLPNHLPETVAEFKYRSSDVGKTFRLSPVFQESSERFVRLIGKTSQVCIDLVFVQLFCRIATSQRFE